MSEHQAKNTPPSYDDLWNACIDYENQIAKLETENKRLREAISSMAYLGISHPHLVTKKMKLVITGDT